MLKASLLFLCLMVATYVDGQIVNIGKCPRVRVQPTLDLSRFMGNWYQMAYVPSWLEEGVCASANYTHQEHSQFKVRLSAVRDGEVKVDSGDGYRPDEREEAKLKFRLREGSLYDDIWILKTDYQSYSLIWSCSEQALFYEEYFWILSRSKTIDHLTRLSLEEDLRSFGINTSKMATDDHSLPICNK